MSQDPRFPTDPVPDDARKPGAVPQPQPTGPDEDETTDPDDRDEKEDGNPVNDRRVRDTK